MGALVLASLLLGLAGCSDDAPPPPEPEPTPAAAPPVYDPALAPAAAVLALVPDSAMALSLSDYDEVRDDLGASDLTTASPVADQDAFWARARSEAAMVGPELLEPVEARLRSEYGLSRLDVGWEAHFYDQAGTEQGWVLGLGESAAVDAVQRAVRDGVGPLAGATVDAANRLVTRGATADGSTSWAAEPEMVDLVGPEGQRLEGVGWWVDRSCVPAATEGTAVPGDVEPLEAWSVQLESALATARLGGEDRTDLFERVELSTAFAPFASSFAGGVADPLTGRLGFRMSDPAAAADLVQRRRLLFAACAR